MELFKLFGSVLIDNDKANQSLDSTEKKGKGVGETLGSMIGTAAKVGTAVASGLAVAGGAMIGLATKAGNAADRILDLSSITGMSTDEIQRWERVTKVAGVSADAMTNASQKLTRQFAAMDTEGNKSRQAMEKLGFSVKEIEKMNADERMNALTKALADIEDPTERARIGTDLFAGSWKDIAPIVDLGAEAMDRAKSSANIVSEDDLNRANDFRIRLALMADQASHFAMMLGIRVLPIAEKFFDWIEEYMPQIEEGFVLAFTVIETVVGTAVDVIDKYLIPILQFIFAWVAEHMPEIQAYFNFTFKTIEEIISAFVTIAMALWGMFGEYFLTQAKTAFETIKAIIDAVLTIIRGIIDVFIGFVTGDWERFGDGLRKIWSGTWDGIRAIVSGGWNLLSTAFSALYDAIRSWFARLKDDAIQWGKNMIQGFIDGIKSMIGAVTSAVSDVISRLNPLSGGSSSGTGLVGATIDRMVSRQNLQGLATGGDVVKSGRFLVGERGIEEVFLPAGTAVRPLDNKEQNTIENNYIFHSGAITIPAKDLAEIKTIMDFFNRLLQAARSQGVPVYG